MARTVELEILSAAVALRQREGAERAGIALIVGRAEVPPVDFETLAT